MEGKIIILISNTYTCFAFPELLRSLAMPLELCHFSFNIWPLRALSDMQKLEREVSG